MDGEAVYALLHTPSDEVPTDLLVPVGDLYEALVIWLGLHEPAAAWMTAEGDAMARGLVPAFFDETDGAVSSFGLFEPGGVALFVRRDTTEDGGGGRRVSVGVRVHGDRSVGERLRTAARAWDQAGRPGLAHLRIRAIPIEHPHEPRPGETVIMRMCTRFVLDWRGGPRPPADEQPRPRH